jgi:hypothetical protein
MISPPAATIPTSPKKTANFANAPRRLVKVFLLPYLLFHLQGDRDVKG